MLIFASSNLPAQTIAPPKQSAESIKILVEDFVRKETLSLPGSVTITVGRLDPQLALAPCAAISASSPAGSKLWGRTTVVVRCTAPTSWTIYLPVTVSLVAPHLAAAKSIAAGQILAENDVDLVSSDVTTLLRGYLTDPHQVAGRVAAMQIMANAPLRPDSFKQISAIQAGQAVRIRAKGNGFTVTSEGVALTSANMGQPVQARTAAGQKVNGIAVDSGLVEVVF